MPRSDALGHDWCMRWMHPPGQLQPEEHNDLGGMGCAECGGTFVDRGELEGLIELREPLS